MLQHLSLPAYLAIARMVVRTTPFDVELALLVVEEVSRELRFKPGEPRGESLPAPGLANAGEDAARAGRARRGIAMVIAEIDRRLGAIAAPASASAR